jgi:hypothetical protein
MKQLLLLPFLFLTVPLLHAQTEALHNFIESHRHDKAFTFAYLSKDLFEVVTESDIKEKDWKKLHQVVRNIGSLRILAADSIANGLDLYREARSLVPAGEFDELLSVRAERENVRIWSKDDGRSITDLVLLVGSPDEFVLVCFAGELELGNISELARLFDAAGAETLARATDAMAIEFTISPNPSDGRITLSYQQDGDAPMLLSVTDPNGRQLATRQLSGASTETIALYDLPAGMYWLQLRTQKGNIGLKQLQIVRP